MVSLNVLLTSLGKLEQIVHMDAQLHHVHVTVSAGKT